MTVVELRERSLWYESVPSVATCVSRLKSAPGGPIKRLWMPAPGSPDHITTLDEMNTIRQAALTGLYDDPHWHRDDSKPIWHDLIGQSLIDPLAYRKQLSAAIKKLLLSGEPVMLDLEKVPPLWLQQFLLGRAGDATQGYRGSGGSMNGAGANPLRPSCWTDASFQMGDYVRVDVGTGNTLNAVELLQDCGFAFFVQLYYGAMQPVEAVADAMKEPVYYGMNALNVYPFYDAAHPPDGWREGCLFTSNRYLHVFTVAS